MTMSFTASARAKTKNEELKKALLTCLRSEKDSFEQVAQAFYDLESRNDQDYLECSHAIVEAIDRILAAGNWEDSLFLHNTVKPLQKIREQVLALQQQMNGVEVTGEIEKRQIQENDVLLYLSMYQSDGNNLRKWELQLNSIESHMIGRPIYENEEDMQKSIRRKLAQESEGYVVIVVPSNALRTDRYQAQRVDRNGNALVTLEEGVVSANSIIEFVHLGKRYYFIKGKLVE